ncbi:MAG TPA: hypothetical protein VHW64_08830 [Nocardioides sp.]|uniref:hypothetical protein n=1 Tax=Nocardioides sp. TaxID=35761 RepID=UPI002E32A236|nr:hypothetical protein [Nocardioides sp.]HEX3930796.1 hypothetical protein [Nocardioides sp.]
MVHYRGGRAAVDTDVYADLEQFWADLTRAYAQDEPEHQHELYIRNINAAPSRRPDGIRVTTHMCRGDFRSSGTAEVGCDFVAEALFSELEVDGLFLEYDDERSGGFASLRFVPAGEQVAPGLVTTKNGVLEDKRQLKRRIDEASEYVSLDQLCLSPRCGFSSTVEGIALTYEEEIAKLRLIVETAEEVWGWFDLAAAHRHA